MSASVPWYVFGWTVFTSQVLLVCFEWWLVIALIICALSKDWLGLYSLVDWVGFADVGFLNGIFFQFRVVGGGLSLFSTVFNGREKLNLPLLNSPSFKLLLIDGIGLCCNSIPGLFLLQGHLTPFSQTN